MERKIGEIFEYNGEWYQCVGGTCRNCSFYYDITCKNISKIGTSNFGNCYWSLRTDNKSIIFKKLEKVGKPYILEDKKFQKYRVFKTPYIYHKIDYSWQSFADPYYVSLEIKQNKEDMEEKNNAKHSNSESIGKNLKPFSLEAAKAGKPVCTRDGRKARIICFDKKGGTPIVGLIQEDGFETVATFNESGLCLINGAYNLMMLPEKKEGWVNVYKERIYSTKEEAIEATYDGVTYVDTVKVCWEE